MGKNLKGKEIGKGIRQRKDGRYEARIMYLAEVLPGVPGPDSSMSVSKWY